MDVILALPYKGTPSRNFHRKAQLLHEVQSDSQEKGEQEFDFEQQPERPVDKFQPDFPPERDRREDVREGKKKKRPGKIQKLTLFADAVEIELVKDRKIALSFNKETSTMVLSLTRKLGEKDSIKTFKPFEVWIDEAAREGHTELSLSQEAFEAAVVAYMKMRKEKILNFCTGADI